MKDKIMSIISIAIDIILLVLVALIYFSTFEIVFSKNTMCGILITFWWIMLCIIDALVLSKDIKKAGDVFGK